MALGRASSRVRSLSPLIRRCFNSAIRLSAPSSLCCQVQASCLQLAFRLAAVSITSARRDSACKASVRMALELSAVARASTSAAARAASLARAKISTSQLAFAVNKSSNALFKSVARSCPAASFNAPDSAWRRSSPKRCSAAMLAVRQVCIFSRQKLSVILLLLTSISVWFSFSLPFVASACKASRRRRWRIRSALLSD